MKIVALGDTHGRYNWKDIVAKESDADKIVFIGDNDCVEQYSI